MNESMSTLGVIDSHTEGEPTRVVVDGFPDLGGGTVAEQLEVFRSEYDHLRSAIVEEPRGHDAVVGALLCEPEDNDSAAGVIFFNNVGYLGMCGHGTIGVISTLEYMGRLEPGRHRIETPAGAVEARLFGGGVVAVRNVPSYRYESDRVIEVPGYGSISGDIAWGGNWFFLVKNRTDDVGPERIGDLTSFAKSIRSSLERNGVTGEGGALIDHIEIYGKPGSDRCNSRSFVLCPGGEYDRSPCGTGTSAKLACMYEDGLIRPGEVWRQESVIGSVFEGSVEIDGGEIIPTIKGTAHITARSELLLAETDPFRYGFDLGRKT